MTNVRSHMPRLIMKTVTTDSDRSTPFDLRLFDTPLPFIRPRLDQPVRRLEMVEPTSGLFHLARTTGLYRRDDFRAEFWETLIFATLGASGAASIIIALLRI